MKCVWNFLCPIWTAAICLSVSFFPMCKQEASAEPLTQVFQHDQPKRKECIGFVPGRTSVTVFSKANVLRCWCKELCCWQLYFMLTAICAHMYTLSRMKLTLRCVKNNEESRGLKQHEHVKCISCITIQLCEPWQARSQITQPEGSIVTSIARKKKHTVTYLHSFAHQKLPARRSPKRKGWPDDQFPFRAMVVLSQGVRWTKSRPCWTHEGQVAVLQKLFSQAKRFEMMRVCRVVHADTPPERRSGKGMDR